MRSLCVLGAVILVFACSEDERPRDDDDGSTGSGTSGGTGGSSTSSVSTSVTSTGSGGTVGCHLDCACYEPPYHPAEIDCSLACSRIAALCASDPSCWACTYYENEESCGSSCAGIAATWEEPNVATYLASVVYGCAMKDSSCEGMTACSNAHTAQQESVCP